MNITTPKYLHDKWIRDISQLSMHTPVPLPICPGFSNKFLRDTEVRSHTAEVLTAHLTCVGAGLEPLLDQAASLLFPRSPLLFLRRALGRPAQDTNFLNKPLTPVCCLSYAHLEHQFPTHKAKTSPFFLQDATLLSRFCLKSQLHARVHVSPVGGIPALQQELSVLACVAQNQHVIRHVRSPLDQHVPLVTRLREVVENPPSGAETTHAFFASTSWFLTKVMKL